MSDDNTGSKTVKTYSRSGNKILIDGNELAVTDDNLRALSLNGGWTSYEYKDGNAVKYTYHPWPWDGERTATLDLKYDNRNGIFRYVQTPAWFLTLQIGDVISYRNLQNNCIEESEDGYVNYEYENTYNADGYPTRIDRKPINVAGDASLRFDMEYTAAD